MLGWAIKSFLENIDEWLLGSGPVDQTISCPAGAESVSVRLGGGTAWAVIKCWDRPIIDADRPEAHVPYCAKSLRESYPANVSNYIQWCD